MERALAGRVGRADYPQIGAHLRTRRQQLGLSLRELGDRLGVSASLISQIERGLANPSVSTLYALVAELDVSLDDLLFTDGRLLPRSADEAALPPARSKGASPIQRGHDRQHIRLASGVIWERLTTRAEPGVEFLYVIYDVGGASSSDDSHQRHAGHEWGYVVSGVLQVTIGFEAHVLESGDSVSFDSTTPHRLANIGDTPVHAIWFVLGRNVSAPEPARPSTLR
jgi:transcriptional regulator with XRE-family HTH domain